MKQYSIRLGGKTISYVPRVSKRARTLSLTMYGDGSLVLTMPESSSREAAEKFLHERSRWIFRNLAKSRTHKQVIPKTCKRTFEKYKPYALQLVKQRVMHFNVYYRMHIRDITVRNATTQWGSCSSSGRLSFNYKIIFLPPSVRDYVIVHELCHLRELNHSKRFWAAVAEIMPDYRLWEKELHEHALARF